VQTISSAEDFWMFNDVARDRIPKGMFFLMREHVFPCYDDVSNKDGGCFSIKVRACNWATAICNENLVQVPNEIFAAYWEKLCVAVLAESLVSNADAITGISTSPKKQFCIIKIWISQTDTVVENDLVLPKGHIGEVLFRAWGIGTT
jgi:hypothetical protein